MVDEQPTTQNKSGVIRPGDIDIGDIVLTCKNGFKANLKEIIVELNINEDIFSPFIYGELSLVDTHGLLRYGPILGAGEESLLVTYNTPCTDPVQLEFVIYKVKDRSKLDRDSTEAYTLCFTTPEALKDKEQKIYKTFTGKTYSDYAKQIHKEYLKVEGGPELEFTPTNYITAFTSDGWTPFQCMKYMANRAIPKKFSEFEFARGYLFFRSFERYKFINVLSQMQQDPVAHYRYINNRMNSGISQFDLLSNFFSIESFVMKNNDDAILDTLNGKYGSTGIHYNPFHGTITESVFDDRYLNRVTEDATSRVEAERLRRYGQDRPTTGLTQYEISTSYVYDEKEDVEYGLPTESPSEYVSKVFSTDTKFKSIEATPQDPALTSEEPESLNAFDSREGDGGMIGSIPSGTPLAALLPDKTSIFKQGFTVPIDAPGSITVKDSQATPFRRSTANKSFGAVASYEVGFFNERPGEIVDVEESVSKGIDASGTPQRLFVFDKEEIIRVIGRDRFDSALPTDANGKIIPGRYRMEFFSTVEGDFKSLNEVQFNQTFGFTQPFTPQSKTVLKNEIPPEPPPLTVAEKEEFASVDSGLDYTTVINANQERRSQMQQFKGMVIEVTVPGDSRRRVGDIVRTEFPAEPVVPNRQDDTTDLSISGKYMVTHIRHQIRKDDYKLVMELSRNSRAKRIPDINQGIEPETAPS